MVRQYAILRTAANRGNFRAWLILQADRDDPVSRLAADAIADRGFPGDGDLSDYRAYLRKRGAGEVAQQALKKAWREFKAEVGP
jgi:hypothetical protein